MPETHYTVQMFSDGLSETFELYKKQSSYESTLLYRANSVLGIGFVTYSEVDLHGLFKGLEDISIASVKHLIHATAQFGGLFYPLLTALLELQDDMSAGRPMDLSEVNRHIEFLTRKQRFLTLLMRLFFMDNTTEDMLHEYLQMARSMDPEIYAPVYFGLTEMNLITTNEGDEIPVMMLRTTDSEECYNFLLYHMLKNNRRYRICKYCNRLFPVRPQSKVEYCDRPIGEGDKRCIDVGASRRYEKKAADIPAMREYQRSYKAHNARIRYGRMTREEFTVWAEEARAKREQCQAGVLSLEDFVAWLDSDKMK